MYERIAELEAENELLRLQVSAMRRWISRAVEIVALYGAMSARDSVRARTLVKEHYERESV
jgi:hypothetical protein